MRQCVPPGFLLEALPDTENHWPMCLMWYGHWPEEQSNWMDTKGGVPDVLQVEAVEEEGCKLVKENYCLEWLIFSRGLSLGWPPACSCQGTVHENWERMQSTALRWPHVHPPTHTHTPTHMYRDGPRCFGDFKKGSGRKSSSNGFSAAKVVKMK